MRINPKNFEEAFVDDPVSLLVFIIIIMLNGPQILNMSGYGL